MPKIASAAIRVGSSERAKKLSGSQPAGVTTDIIPLHIGDPSFTTPDYIREAAIEAINQGYTHYFPALGDKQLREAIAAELSTLGGGMYSPNEVLITNGANSAIYAAMVAYLDPNDEVLIHDPTYSLYQDIVLAIGAKAVTVSWASDVFPSIVIGVALLQYYRTIHFGNVFITMIFGHVIVAIPYTIRTVTASLEVFDYSMLDAARVFGADTLRTFTNVMLPIIKPGIFAGSIFSFLISFDNYTVSLFLANAKNITLPIRIYSYAYNTIDPSVAAVSTIMICVSVLIFVVGGKLIGVKELSRF